MTLGLSSTEVVEVRDEVFDFFPFCLSLEVEVGTDVETVIVSVGASVIVTVTVLGPSSLPLLGLSSVPFTPVPFTGGMIAPDGRAVGLLLSSEILLVLSSTEVGDAVPLGVGSSLPLSGWAARLARAVVVGALSSVEVSVEVALSSVAVGELSSLVGEGLSSVVKVTPVTKPVPVGNNPVETPIPVPKSVLVESPVG